MNVGVLALPTIDRYPFDLDTQQILSVITTKVAQGKIKIVVNGFRWFKNSLTKTTSRQQIPHQYLAKESGRNYFDNLEKKKGKGDIQYYRLPFDVIVSLGKSRIYQSIFDINQEVVDLCSQCNKNKIVGIRCGETKECRNSFSKVCRNSFSKVCEDCEPLECEDCDDEEHIALHSKLECNKIRSSLHQKTCQNGCDPNGKMNIACQRNCCAVRPWFCGSCSMAFDFVINDDHINDRHCSWCDDITCGNGNCIFLCKGCRIGFVCQECKSISSCPHCALICGVCFPKQITCRECLKRLCDDCCIICPKCNVTLCGDCYPHDCFALLDVELNS